MAATMASENIFGPILKTNQPRTLKLVLKYMFLGPRNPAVPLFFMSRSWMHGKSKMAAKMGGES